MKRLLLILILTFSFQLWAAADDIRDFQIEGMSIGDSLLDHFTKNEIKKMPKTDYPGSDKYIMLTYNSSTKFDKYETVAFHVKTNDKSFKIHSIKGGIYYKNDFNKCLADKKDLLKELKSTFKGLETQEEYDFKYQIDDGKSIAYINDLNFKNNDKIRLWCVNWSVVTEKKRNFNDNLSVSLSPNYYLKWLTDEAKQ